MSIKIIIAFKATRAAYGAEEATGPRTVWYGQRQPALQQPRPKHHNLMVIHVVIPPLSSQICINF